MDRRQLSLYKTVGRVEQREKIGRLQVASSCSMQTHVINNAGQRKPIDLTPRTKPNSVIVHKVDLQDNEDKSVWKR